MVSVEPTTRSWPDMWFRDIILGCSTGHVTWLGSQSGFPTNRWTELNWLWVRIGQLLRNHLLVRNKYLWLTSTWINLLPGRPVISWLHSPTAAVTWCTDFHPAPRYLMRGEVFIPHAARAPWVLLGKARAMYKDGGWNVAGVEKGLVGCFKTKNRGLKV